jgi:divalent metal cation (Fe/Co/Zn/Cd) transporter
VRSKRACRRGVKADPSSASPAVAHKRQLDKEGRLTSLAQTTIEFRPRLRSRNEFEQRAKLLAHLGNSWHLLEFGVALGAGIAAGSVALTSFAGDSLVEVLAASVIVWLFSADRGASERAERRAQQLVAASYYLLVAYIVSHTLYDLAAGDKPAASWVGVGLAAVTAPTMPLLARAKRKVGHALNSPATVSEAGQNQICAYLSIALLVGLLLNALAGWWWADPAAALVIAGFALREGRESWRGTACDCC